MCELCQFRKLNGLRRQNSLQGGGVRDAASRCCSNGSQSFRRSPWRARRQLLEECQDRPALQPGKPTWQCRDRLSLSSAWSAPMNRGSLNSTLIHGTHVPVEEPSTASTAEPRAI